jgi:putative transposase
MPRSLRFQYPGAFYHVLARGNRREAIFRDDIDRRFFLKGLGEACASTGWRVHAWALLDNHYHLLLQTPEPNLVAGMQWLQNAYTRRFNTRHRLWGRLFGDRYKAVPVEGSGYYYETLLDYIHLNPVRAGLVAPRREESLLDYSWSSIAQGYGLPPRQRPKWLAAEDGLAAFGCADTAAGRRKYVERLDRRAREEELEQCGVPPLEAERDARESHVRRGWYWGSQSFAESLLKQLSRAKLKKGSRTYRSELSARRHDQAEAERLLQEGLQKHHLTPAELPSLPGNDPRKVAIAQHLRGNTVVSNAWLAEHLAMRSPANVSQILLRAKNAGQPVNVC